MKKFIALAIAILMLTTLAVPAFAADSGTTQITYTVGDSYTLTVPSEITVAGTAAAIAVSEYNVVDAKQVKVTATSAGEWKLNDTYAYVLNETEFTFDDNGSQNVSAAWDEGTVAPTAAGTYTDTVTFTGSIVDKPAAAE